MRFWSIAILSFHSHLVTGSTADSNVIDTDEVSTNSEPLSSEISASESFSADVPSTDSTITEPISSSSGTAVAEANDAARPIPTENSAPESEEAPVIENVEFDDAPCDITSTAFVQLFSAPALLFLVSL